MANPNPCPCGEMEGSCAMCGRAAHVAALFAPVPATAVTCRHGDSAALCILCRTSPLRREEDTKKPQVNPLEFSLWLQSQDTEALAEWITRSGSTLPDVSQ